MELNAILVAFFVYNLAQISDSSKSSDFDYMVCLYDNSSCRSIDQWENANDISDWPSGPYALLTPIDGCPESGFSGWRNGYLSFTWAQPQSITSASYCDTNIEIMNPHSDNITSTTNNTDVNDCLQTLLSDKVHGQKSILLGLGSEYEWRLNFCFKTKDNSIRADMYTWPSGNYSIFGDGKECPKGFTASKVTIKLPVVLSWRAYGHLPGFSISGDKDKSASLVLDTCDHYDVDNDSSLYEFRVTDSFLFLKDKRGAACPNVPYTNVMTEVIKLQAQDQDADGFMELFDLCYFRPNSSQEDIPNYLYPNWSDLPYEIQTVFSITNPTLIYGNSTSMKVDNIETEESKKPLWSHITEYSLTPWLLVDIGRNYIVTGLQFDKYYLPIIDTRDYLGSLNTTLFEMPCQRWDSQAPHRHTLTKDEYFPDKTVSDARNFCRDPYGDGYLWCYVDSPNVRWKQCSESVYSFKETDRPFTKCFISETRWRPDEIEMINCQYSPYYENNLLYIKFLRNVEGRYLKLIGTDEMGINKFYKATRNIQVLTTRFLSYKGSRCNNDLGMSDESILDTQIRGSSWLSNSQPSFGRPFSSGWCADISDMNPHISVDIGTNTIVEGLTFFNWEFIEHITENGIFKKKYQPLGSKSVMITYSTEDNNTLINQNYSFSMFLPIDQPQTFNHNPVLARYITIYIIESMAPDAKCLRFELHGCKPNSRPNLATSISSTISSLQQEPITMTYIQILRAPLSIASINYPKHYPGGEEYTWKINFDTDKFVQLLFTNISLNVYDLTSLSNCQDSITLLPVNVKNRMAINEDFNGLVTLIEMDASDITLTFTSCRPTSKIKSIGSGFKAVVRHKDIPTCFAAKSIDNLFVISLCDQQSMFISSLSRFNFPESSLPEQWTICIRRHSIHIRILYFNVRCYTGSSLTFTERFAGVNTYCNTKRPPSDWFSNSNSVNVRFEKGGLTDTSNIQSREGFKAFYKTVEQPMDHVIDFKKIYHQSILQTIKLERKWDPGWKNASLLMYQACSLKFGKCYEIYSGAMTNWQTAGQECWLRQGRLVSIHSKKEHRLINYILRNYKYVDLGEDTVQSAFTSDKVDPTYFTHIGLSRVTSRTGLNVHLWEDGSKITYSAWMKDEPSGGNDCTRMSFHLFNTNNTWESENCKTSLANYFVCEHSRVNNVIGKTFLSYLYNGTLNSTLSGHDCQRWDLQHPNEHQYIKNEMFPDLTISAAENYCRDPGGDGYIWCYTLEPSTRYDKCLKSESSDVPSIKYTGRLSKTSSGRTCQRWDSYTPFKHKWRLLSFFPDESFEEVANHCRDPSNSGVLWCYTTDPKRRWDQCDFKDIAEDRCYTSHSEYTGQWNITISGLECQHWNSFVPHEHEQYLDSQFPENSVRGASNFCRDPLDKGFLWCFTMDPAIRWEPCLFDDKYQLSNFTKSVPKEDGKFVCDSGDTISLGRLCNGKPDCPDISDEIGCTDIVQQLMMNRTSAAQVNNELNSYSVFECDSSERVSMLARCDKIVDCIDGSDEMNCSYNEGKCLKGEFACENGECIHKSQMCDHIADCKDGSDEICDFPLCTTKEFRCRNQQCIPAEDTCNAYKNCLDGSDEETCDACKDNSFHCDLSRCIPKRLVCDDYIDCKDGTDEDVCQQPVYKSCEEWWNAGYKTSGIFTLNQTQIVCDFGSVNENSTVYTIFKNFELKTRTRAENIQFKNIDEIKNTHFLNDSYYCYQEIKQSCIPAYKTLEEFNNRTTPDKTCISFTMKISPYRTTTVNRTYHYTENEMPVSDNDLDLVLFDYIETDDSQLLKLPFDDRTEVTVGPVICSIELATASHDDMRCMFDIDSAGFTTGSRSGNHLQNCDTASTDQRDKLKESLKKRDIETLVTEHVQCPVNTVKCPNSFCLPLRFVCDGEIQCPGGEDEADCGCDQSEREIIFLFNRKEDCLLLRKIASQFYTPNGIIRELRFTTTPTRFDVNFDKLLLDISDTVISVYSAHDREFTCNYTLLASDFINRIEFTKASSRGLIYFQSANESDLLEKHMFGDIRSQPNFHIYRIREEVRYKSDEAKEFQFVDDVVLRTFRTLVGLGSRYFPGLCKEAATVTCTNEYKCAASKTCIPIDQVCDGQAQCLHGDDERLCDYSCPQNCTCSEFTTDCTLNDIESNPIPSVHRNTRSLDLSGNDDLHEILTSPITNLPFLISLNISKCSIKVMAKSVFSSMVNLRELDLGFNKLVKIPTSAFLGLRKLKYLNLLGNTDIQIFEPNSMSGLSSIKILEIIGVNIDRLSSRTFAGLRLDKLLLFGNNIKEMEDGVFSEMAAKILDMEANQIATFDKGLFRGVSGISSLHTPAFKFCCIRPNYLVDENCFPEKDEFSSCADLLRVSALQTMLWLIGLVALFGNILSVIYRLVYDRERLKLGFGIFVTNLAIADFIMGIYLIIIAVADAAYRKRYIFMDEYWRNSAWCTLAGFLSTVSSEASVFFLCLITLDRLLVIKYPFGQVRFNTRTAGIASSVAWFISVSVGLIPIINKDHFQDKFYSKSGVCIALPLTRDRPPGWLYSIVLFVGLNFVTFCLIALGQVIIYMEIKKASSGIRRSSMRKGKSGTGRRRELAVARNLFLVVSTDFLCWFPIGCMGMMAMSGHVIPGEVYAWTAVFILPINSALNPVLYTLTALLAKKKAKAQRETQNSFASTSPRRVRKPGPLTGVFRYFITKGDHPIKSFISLSNLSNEDIYFTSVDVLKIVRNLSHCLCLLHKNSLIVKLDDNVIYASVENGKVTGDVQIRQEPTVSICGDMKTENIYQLGQVSRRLLAKSINMKENNSNDI